MTHDKRATVAVAMAAAMLLCLTAAAANPEKELVSGVVVTHETGQLVIDTDEGQKTFTVDAALVPIDLVEGDIVLVGVAEPGSMQADRLIVVDEQVIVTEDLEAERAVIGTVSAVSPQQLLVETTTGEQAFVIAPEKLFPPLPEPDLRLTARF